MLLCEVIGYQGKGSGVELQTLDHDSEDNFAGSVLHFFFLTPQHQHHLQSFNNFTVFQIAKNTSTQNLRCNAQKKNKERKQTRNESRTHKIAEISEEVTNNRRIILSVLTKIQASGYLSQGFFEVKIHQISLSIAKPFLFTVYVFRFTVVCLRWRCKRQEEDEEN
ncbi:unnamed protein product [Vicia faba]|uniref:Uncharacterized protein n=1 Tax=Vicia faba TaxID=3906 RepID=A0AAV0YTC7_VICFA|nr:unnamed protein product [Vicia faba]